MRWFLYNALFVLGFPPVALRYLPRMWRRGGYRQAFGQRFGWFEPALKSRLAEPRRLWVHGVSVGEVGVALRLMAVMRTLEPGRSFVLSTTTSTGYALASARIEARDLCMYLPLDYPWIVRRVFKRLRPQALILVESEFWPNLIRTACALSIPLFLVNGRISDRSYPGYQRLRFWFGPLLRCFDRLFVQSEMDAGRLLDIGAEPARVETSATLKFDVDAPPPADVANARAVCRRAGITVGTDTVLMGGSTWPGEERLLLQIYRTLRRQQPGLRLILAPRHAERADEIQAEILQAGLTCRRVRDRCPGPAADPSGLDPAVLLLDTTGALLRFYACADVVFVGKSLCARGAQNMIEPAGCGCAVLVGPHTGNFREVMRVLRAADAIRPVADAAELEVAVRELVAHPDARTALGDRARAVVEARRGVTRACAGRILETVRAREAQ